MGLNPFKYIFDKITKTLMKERRQRSSSLTDYNRLCYEIRPGDVILIAGRSRVSRIISEITHSPWTHAILYIGRIHDISSDKHRNRTAELFTGSPSEQLVVESLMGEGVIVTPLSRYKYDHMRICRPKGISKQDADRVIEFTIDQLGKGYDTRQLLDLARFFFPWSIFPRRWRSSLFSHNAGEHTQQVCSSLIAEAFLSVHFPVLPLIRKAKERIAFFPRNPRLFTPSDFDFSPYFEIIKYPMFELESAAFYRDLPWDEEGRFSDTEGNIYQPEIREEVKQALIAEQKEDVDENKRSEKVGKATEEKDQIHDKEDQMHDKAEDMTSTSPEQIKNNSTSQTQSSDNNDK